MKAITKEQNKKLHTLLSQLKLMEQKREMILEVTENRTSSAKELTFEEAKIMIQHLSQFDSSDRMRLKVYALAYEAGIIYGDTPEDKRMNSAKIDQFLLLRGAVKKKLHSLQYKELITVVNQFEGIVKHTRQSKENKDAKSITQILLNELNISTL